MGWDLTRALAAREADFFVADRSHGWEWPDSGLDDLVASKPDVVWCCVGFGGVAETSSDYTRAITAHVGLAVDCMMRFPEETKLVFFSSDHAANERNPGNPKLHSMSPKSLFALSKLQLEEAFGFLNRPNTTIVRLSSIYGGGRPSRTFPGRLIAQYAKPCEIPLPSNLCTPTPTDWLAETMLRRLDKLVGEEPKVVHLAPSGHVSYAQWGRLIMGPKFDVKERGLDESRPAAPLLGCSIGPVPSWKDLWDRIGRKTFNLK